MARLETLLLVVLIAIFEFFCHSIVYWRLDSALPPGAVTPSIAPGGCPVSRSTAGYRIELRTVFRDGDRLESTVYLDGRAAPLACAIGHCGDDVTYAVAPEGAGFVNWSEFYVAKVTMSAPGRMRVCCERRPDVCTEFPVV